MNVVALRRTAGDDNRVVTAPLAGSTVARVAWPPTRAVTKGALVRQVREVKVPFQPGVRSRGSPPEKGTV